MIRPSILLRLLIVLVLQAAALGWMVLDRAELLRSGTEVELSVVPIDPRDLFRGDFVQLNYDITTLRPGMIGGDTDYSNNDPIWVVLDKSVTGPAQPVGIFRRRPPTQPDRVAIRGRVQSIYEGAPPVDDPDACPSPCRTLRVAYGIEQYFVPEGEGRNIENLRDDSLVAVIVAIGDDGVAAIKKLKIDGVDRYEEPLF